MAQQLVRVRIDGREVTVGRNYAAAKGLDVLDAPAASFKLQEAAQLLRSGRATLGHQALSGRFGFAQ